MKYASVDQRQAAGSEVMKGHVLGEPDRKRAASRHTIDGDN